MPAAKPPSRIHITAVGSSAIDEVKHLGVSGVAGLIRLAQQGVGSRYKVTANARMILPKQINAAGGRTDDAARVREIETLLADDNVAALVTLRGGAWFTRILERINFDILDRRRKLIYLFGFSEMSTLIAIASQYPNAVGVYDLGPGFLYGGMKDYARKCFRRLAGSINLAEDQREGFAAGWALARFPRAFTAFFSDVADILEGKSIKRVPSGRLLAGSLPSTSKISITGGNLSVLLPLIGSRFAGALDTSNKWLAIEDVNESAESIDRMLAGLKLGGWLNRVKGIILGDFHDGDTELSKAAFDLLKMHLPTKRRVPVIALENFGHIYPMAPLPMHRVVTLRCKLAARGKARVTIDIPWKQWASR